VSSKQNEQFINSAKSSGCKKIISEHELSKHIDFSSIQIVGITGTNGKTTTAGGIYSLLLDLGYKVALQGTRGFYINDQQIKEYSLTTPVQIETFSNIQEAINNDCDFFIMEVSSHAIAQNRICGLDFALKIHTNITRDHLDYHHTIEEYINIKNSFFNDDSFKLINKDDKNVRFKLKNAVSYGLDNPSTYKVQAFTFKKGTTVAFQYFGKMYSFVSEMRGTFNVYNLICALSATHILSKKPLEEICTAIENFAGVTGRMEVVSIEPYIIVDFAHTPDGMKAVLESFKDKDIICVFGAGGDRDKNKREIMGKIANEYSKYIILTADNPRFEDPDAIIEDIYKGISDKNKTVIEINRKKAIQIAIDTYSPNSVILVLGKGDEEYQTIYDKKLPFNDKVTIKNLLS
jgi:UDP-N-acetylmuramoyl-L-alanyl-D-glutamate--2,6-diaminopimelate ligase